MTALRACLLREIRATGPISVAEYMQRCLLHPDHGYYATRDPLGRAGDFITAPEISQMFGELVGLALAQAWLDQGAPAPFALTELGPGRGTLMADALRATRGVTGFHAALQLHLVEASPVLRAAQAARLEGWQIRWHDTVDTLPEMPLFLIANEFFDALPVRQFIRQGSGWAERMVGAQSTALVFGRSDPVPLTMLAHRLEDTVDGTLIEHCPGAAPVMAALDERIADHGGLALVIDYGDWRSRGDTLQAMRAHEFDPPLAHPGEADLTAHVDFEALVRAAPRLHTTALTPQGVWLERLGITARAQALARNLTGAALASHAAAHRRLTHPAEMGNLFKVLALHPRGAPPPPGFAK